MLEDHCHKNQPGRLSSELHLVGTLLCSRGTESVPAEPSTAHLLPANQSNFKSGIELGSRKNSMGSDWSGAAA